MACTYVWALLVLVQCLGAFSTTGHHSWSQWSLCSTTCGNGLRWRERRCRSTSTRCKKPVKESKHCNLRFCPSYLSWPRIHFSGNLAADVNTVNNIRCAYENKEFSAAQLSKHFIGVETLTSTHIWFKRSTGNWNPDGSNQIYFVDTFVTSFCHGPGRCFTNDSIVGLKVTESTRGVMAVVDPDWQLATEIWGLKIKIPGILEGTFSVSSHQVEKTRVDKVVDRTVGYAIPNMSRYKSKLFNVTWFDNYYKQLFFDAKELSISITYDLFNQVTLLGRITGTIGLTSADDAKETVTSRVLQALGTAGDDGRGAAPFYLHYSKKILTMDFSIALGGRQNGSFLASDIGRLDLAIMLPLKTVCKYYPRTRYCSETASANTLIWSRLTTGGEVSRRVGYDSVWYLTYGGLMDFDLSHLDRRILRLLRSNRVIILDSDDSTYMTEFPNGINIGLINESIFRLNVGESKETYGFVASYGRPVKSAQMAMYVVKGAQAGTDCGRPSCNQTMGEPADALGISSNQHITLTNSSGLAKIVFTGLSDPGNVRGCGLDGQIYPMQIFVRYSKNGKSITFSDSGEVEGGTKHDSDYASTTQSTALHLYNSVPEKVCPTWDDDVRDVFVQYYNLYPVMWKSGIIDLHSYDEIKRKAKMLNAAMFDTDIHDPQYMPISRDLSYGKRKLIWNWMKCGMRKTSPPSKKKKQTCSTEYVNKGLRDVRLLIHKAVMLELSTIPPYLTAWLSLKTEFGRNKEIAGIVKKVFNEEMLHMTLAGNILNAVGGVVNMTDESKLPVYPTILSTGDFYQICPDMQVGLAPFSLGLVEDVFSNIEKPSDFKSKEYIRNLAEIWKMLPSAKNETEEVSSSMRRLLQEISTKTSNRSSESTANSTSSFLLKYWRELWNSAHKVLAELEELNSRSVGEFYSLIALKLTTLESCARVRKLESAYSKEKKTENLPGTVFSGDPKRQLSISQWYQQSEEAVLYVMDRKGATEKMQERRRTTKGGVVRHELFPVTDLKSALEAIVEIVYQGEGGSDCSPFVTEPFLYGSEIGRDEGRELSHYYRFQEIVNGRKLIKIRNPPIWTDWNCLNRTDASVCPSLSNSDESYCYAGERITFYEDGVWPILSNPKASHFTKGSKAHRLHEQFNLLYTRLLFCIQEAFDGEPNRIRKCMSLMYDMTITGKRLVQTPLLDNSDSEQGGMGTSGSNGAPTWDFIREKPYAAGFPIRD